MERKFYTNDFEQLLKESADQFKMSPSKKVWRGIYNDIKPGTRWPSIAMSLLFVGTLILVGYLNTEPSQHKDRVSTLQKNIIREQDKNPVVAAQRAGGTILNNTRLNDKAGATKNTTGTAQQNLRTSGQIGQQRIAATTAIANGGVQTPGTERMLTIAAPQIQSLSANNKATGINGNDQVFSENGSTEAVAVNGSPSKASEHLIVLPAALPVVNGVVIKRTVNTSSHGNDINKPVAFTHQKIHKNVKISWAYYLSPGISYRVYSKQGDPRDQLSLGYASNSSSLKDAVTHLPAAGLEAGGAFKYAISKKLKITTGVQLNYSDYTIQANNIHPIIATLVLHRENTGIPYDVSTISYFGNGSGNVPVNLHNYNAQVALPIGMEYQVAGNERVQFSAAGTFQPSLVIASKGYILSTDKRYYFTDAPLLRNWNIGTNLGAFVSFNSNKLKWQIGPQVRYQLLSSYSNEYQVREHYIDYSIRFAISKLR